MNQYSQPLGRELNLASLEHKTQMLSGTLCIYMKGGHITPLCFGRGVQA
jgi:hypothetical protein